MKRLIGIAAIAMSLFAGSAFADRDDRGWRDGPDFKHRYWQYQRNHYRHYNDRGWYYPPRVENYYYYPRPYRNYAPRPDYGYGGSYNQQFDLHYRFYY